MESLTRYEWMDDEGYQFYVDVNSPEPTNASAESLMSELIRLARSKKADRVLRNVSAK